MHAHRARWVIEEQFKGVRLRRGGWQATRLCATLRVSRDASPRLLSRGSLPRFSVRCPMLTLAMDSAERSAEAFTKLDSELVSRITAFGRQRHVMQGEALVEQGQTSPSFYVVLRGAIEIVVTRPDATGEEIVRVEGPGEFTGELDVLAGSRSLVRARAREPSEVLEVDRNGLRRLVATDPELSDILIRTFIVRRMVGLAHNLSDTLLVGLRHSAATLGLREFLSRNGQPYTYLDLEGAADVEGLVERFQVRVEDIPVLVSGDNRVLRNPSKKEVADCLGFNPRINESAVRDVVVVGAGPAGLAASLCMPPPRASMSSWWKRKLLAVRQGRARRLRTTWAFRRGSLDRTSRRGLTRRRQSSGPRSWSRGPPWSSIASALHTSSGSPKVAAPVPRRRHRQRRSVSKAVNSRSLALRGLRRLLRSDARRGPAMHGGRGHRGRRWQLGRAGGSLSRHSRPPRAHARTSAGSSETMSRYLVRRIENNSAITLRLNTEVVALEGRDVLASRSLAQHDHRGGGDSADPPRLHDDRGRPEHRLAEVLPRPRRPRIRQDRDRSRSEVPGWLARDDASSLRARDEHSPRLRGGRHPIGKHQARGLRRR